MGPACGSLGWHLCCTSSCAEPPPPVNLPHTPSHFERAVREEKKARPGRALRCPRMRTTCALCRRNLGARLATRGVRAHHDSADGRERLRGSSRNASRGPGSSLPKVKIRREWERAEPLRPECSPLRSLPPQSWFRTRRSCALRARSQRQRRVGQPRPPIFRSDPLFVPVFKP